MIEDTTLDELIQIREWFKTESRWARGVFYVKSKDTTEENKIFCDNPQKMCIVGAAIYFSKDRPNVIDTTTPLKIQTLKYILDAANVTKFSDLYEINDSDDGYEKICFILDLAIKKRENDLFCV